MQVSKLGDTLEDYGKQDFGRFLSSIVNKDADNLVLGGNVDDKTFEEFEEIAFNNYGQNANLRIYAHSDYREAIAVSEKVHEDAVKFFDSGYSSTQAMEVLNDSELGDRSIFVVDKEYKEQLRTWIENGKQEIVTIYE